MAGYVFGGNTGVTPEDLVRQRRWAQMMRQSVADDRPQNAWDGIGSIARALSANYADYRAQQQEDKGRAGANETFRSIASLLSDNGNATGSVAPSQGARFDAAKAAFLDTLAGPESGGVYNRLYGGGTFDSYADHPRQNIPITSGPNKGKTSSGSGKFQFLAPTWDEQKKKLKLPDFSPESQDAAAWDLASTAYNKQTGGNLGSDLMNADADGIKKIAGSMAGTWTSMPGGIEQTISGDDFVSAYNRNFAKGQQVQPASFNSSAGIGVTSDAQVPTQWAHNPDQAAGGGLGVDPRILDALSNPWLNDTQRGALQLYFQRQLDAADPRKALEMRKLQAEVGNLETPRPEYGFTVLPDGRMVRTDKSGGSAETIMQSEQKPEYGFTVLPDGRMIRTDKNSGKAEPIMESQPKPTDDITEYGFYRQQAEAAGQTPLPFDQYQMAVKRAGASSINMGGGSDKQIFDALGESAGSARAAVTGLAGIREAKKAIAGGAITGAWANERLALQKVGAWLGVGDPAKIENTETFRAAIAPQVAAMLKATVGSAQISNSDREFAQQAAGGSITLDERSITRLLDIMERAGGAAVQGHMDRLNKVYPDGKGFDRERAIFGVDALPPEEPPAPKPRIRIDGNGRVMQ